MFKVVFEGVEIQCETADEAVEIASKLGSASPERKRTPHFEVNESRWTTHRFQSFIGQLRERQRTFLSHVVSNPDGVTDASLRQVLGLNTNKGMGPILTGISRRAKKLGFSLEDIITSEKLNLTNGDRVLEFKANPAFAKAAE